ncbi:hypothetical protein TRVL_05637 [Trypanosoma vivax]|nr:hypothetical protein TRVL_05637 [Trypanosoma vivax]
MDETHLRDIVGAKDPRKDEQRKAHSCRKGDRTGPQHTGRKAGERRRSKCRNACVKRKGAERNSTPTLQDPSVRGGGGEAEDEGLGRGSTQEDRKEEGSDRGDERQKQRSGREAAGAETAVYSGEGHGRR